MLTFIHDRDLLHLAREATLPHDYLGELHGRSGVDVARKRHFRDTGEILLR